MRGEGEGEGGGGRGWGGEGGGGGREGFATGESPHRSAARRVHSGGAVRCVAAQVKPGPHSWKIASKGMCFQAGCTSVGVHCVTAAEAWFKLDWMGLAHSRCVLGCDNAQVKPGPVHTRCILLCVPEKQPMGAASHR